MKTIKALSLLTTLANVAALAACASEVDGPVTEGVTQALQEAPARECMLPPAPSALQTGGFKSQGSHPYDRCRSDNEVPHDVWLNRDYELMRTEVTQGAFEARMRYNPSTNTACGANCPVESVTWHEAVAYCNILSKDSGLDPCYECKDSGPATSCTPLPAYRGSGLYACRGYRLPTEAEWEAAYYADGDYHPFYDLGPFDRCGEGAYDLNAASVAWYAGSKEGEFPVLMPVGLKKVNASGLYDMAGNVSEWVNDMYVDQLGSEMVTDPNVTTTEPDFVNTRVMKGGFYGSTLGGIRRQSREYDDMNHRSPMVGFRCARTKF